MLPNKLRMTLEYHKNKILIWTICFLLLMLFLKSWRETILETKEELIPMTTNSVLSNNQFNKSTAYVLEEGYNWKKKVTYKTYSDGSKEVFKTEVIEDSKEQKELQWTLEYSEYKVQIQNLVSQYLLNLQNKRWNEANNDYIKFSKVQFLEDQETQNNFVQRFKINSQPLITEFIPLYDHYSTRALVKTIIQWKFNNILLNKIENTWEVYSVWDWGSFKILNPEYINLLSDSVEKERVVWWTTSNKSHYLNLTLSKLYLNWPNKLYLYMEGKTSSDTLFNKVKVALYKKKETYNEESDSASQQVNLEKVELLFSDTIIYRDMSERASWRRTNYKWKSWYRTEFFIPIEFDKKNFFAIYDRMMKKDKLDLSQFIITLEPINDSDPNLKYPTFRYNMDEFQDKEEEKTINNKKVN